MLLNTFPYFFLLLFIQTTSNSLTVEEILKNHFKAINQYKLSSTKSKEIFSDYNSYSDIKSFENKIVSYRGTLHEIVIKNGNYYKKTGFMEKNSVPFYFEYGLSGKDSWEKDGNGIRDFTHGIADSMLIKIETDIDGPLYHWKDKGYIISFIGVRTIHNRNTCCLKSDLRNNQIAYYYIDPVTWLVYCITFYKEYSDETRVPTYFFSEYKRVDEIKIPFKIIEKNYLMNNIITTVRKIKQIKLNQDFDESIFKRPLK